MSRFPRAADDTLRRDDARFGCRQAPAGIEDGGERQTCACPQAVYRALVFKLPGSSFAFVMTTGIVSIAAMRLGHGEVGAVLFVLNLVVFPLLCVLMLVRLLRHPVAIVDELRSHRTGAGFLTVVAATSIVGDQFVLFASNIDIAADLWLASVFLWVVLIYAFLLP